MEVKLTSGEVNALKAIVKNNGILTDGHGYEDKGFVLDEAAKIAGISVKSMKGFCSSLQKKELITMYSDCDCCFSGSFTDKGAEAYQEIVAEENKAFEAPVTDNRIVRLNEIISTKLSSVSRGKRDTLKNEKVAAKFVLENWNNYDGLNNVVSDEELIRVAPETYAITTERFNELSAARKKASTKRETTATATSTDKSVKTTRRGRKPGAGHVVGERHPKHPEWAWTEYKPGKFDWRVRLPWVDEAVERANKGK